MNTDYGTDFGTFISGPDGNQDLDPMFAVISGPRVVLENLARRLLTQSGQLEDSPEFGYDLRRCLNGVVNPGILSQIIQYQCRMDERIESVDVSVSQTTAGYVSIKIDVKLADGTFPLVLTYNQILAQYKAVFGYG